MSKEGVEKRNQTTLAATCWVKVVRSSHDTWTSTELQSKWKEISAEIDAVGNIVKEKTNTWNKKCRERAKRALEVYKTVEQAAVDERQEHKERSTLNDLLQKIQKEREEDEACGIIN